VSISSPSSQANGAFVKERSSFTVEGIGAPSVAPKKQGDACFLSMGGGGGGGGGRCGAGGRTTESIASTQDAVYKRSEPPASLWLLFCVAGRPPRATMGATLQAGWPQAVGCGWGGGPKMMIRTRKCALTESKTGAYTSGVGHRSARYMRNRADTMTPETENIERSESLSDHMAHSTMSTASYSYFSCSMSLTDSLYICVSL